MKWIAIWYIPTTSALSKRQLIKKSGWLSKNHCKDNVFMPNLTNYAQIFCVY